MWRPARIPGTVSVAELYTNGFLSDVDILPGGGVTNTTRMRAEQAYARFLDNIPPPSTRPRTAPPMVASRRPSVSSSSIIASTVSHVKRVQIRSAMDSQSSEHLPTPMVLDTCCVCYGRTRDHAFEPCFHMCVCLSCAKRVRHCPLCRVAVLRVHRIYLA